MKLSKRLLLIFGLTVVVVFLVLCKPVNNSIQTGPPRASSQAGKSETRNSLTTSTSSSASAGARFDSRRILFLTNSAPHPLGRRVNALVAESLASLSTVESVEMGPAMLPQRTNAPDLFLRVELTELKEEGVLNRSLKTVVNATLGNVPWQSPHFVQSSTTPPLVQFHWSAALEHESTFTGVRTDRYSEPAASIAHELVKGITNQIHELARKYPPLPRLPSEFYGPYEPVNDFIFLKDTKAQRAFSYAGLFTRNETFWKFQAPANPVPLLSRISAELIEASWKRYDSSATNREDPYLSFRKGGATLEIFPLRAARLIAGPEQNSPQEFVVHYSKPFSKREQEAALEKLLGAHAALDTLVSFANSFSAKQRERYYAMLEKSPTVSPRAYLQLAENYLRRNDTNAALNVLLRSKALQGTLNTSELGSDIESIAKKISPKQKLQMTVTPEIYRDLGFIEITNSPQTFEAERSLGDPVLIFAETERGSETFCFRINPPRKGSYPWTMVSAQDQSRSWSSGELTLPPKGEWQQNFTHGKRSLKITAHPTPNGSGFKFKFEII